MASTKPAGKNYYAILEVQPDAPARLIKENYRSLVQRFHPDLFRTPAEAEAATVRMIEINEAFAVLSNKKKRAEYDAERTAATPSPVPSPAPAPKPNWDALKTPPSPQKVAANPALNQAVAADFLEKLKKLINNQGAALKLKPESEKPWVWSFSGGTWKKSYWISLARLSVLSTNTLRTTTPQLTLAIKKHNSMWKNSFFIFVLAADAISEGENVLKICRAFCNDKANTSSGKLVNIVIVDLNSRRSIVCGKRPRDAGQQRLLDALTA